ncbi:putative phosphoglycerate mutase [Clavispora lusitaniae]|uniref:Phosphoglycerate mutase n=1 Tax=Clavispora lusitaniae TaxID=36911 RepID=A0AA91T3J0_CLALS|nr:putative phosphoglycerate mutase [Clavispora lusitaniae]
MYVPCEHGKIDGNVKKIIQGHLDLDLNDEGRDQAEKVAHHLKDIDLDYIVSSDLLRCMNTARAIAKKQRKPVGAFESTRALRESYMGPLEGLHFQVAIEKYGPNFETMGESDGDLVARVYQSWDQTCKKVVAEKHSNILFCTHGGVVGAFIRHLYNVRGYKLADGIAPEDLRVPFNTSVTIVDLDKISGEGVVRVFGSTEHLSGDSVVS